VHAVFSANGRETFRTAELLELLHAAEGSPWGDWYGKPLSAHGLSRLLRPYRIKTMTVYVGEGESARGYKRDQFADTFARVLGVRSDRSDRTKSASGAGSNASNASNAHHTNGAPLPGDEFYPLFIAEAGNKGHITEDEFSQLYAHHKLVERAREARA
jgi:hypothetical protein